MKNPADHALATHSKPDRGFGRRRFLKGAATVGAFSIVPRHVLGGAGHAAPSAKITLAAIGSGGPRL